MIKTKNNAASPTARASQTTELPTRSSSPATGTGDPPTEDTADDRLFERLESYLASPEFLRRLQKSKEPPEDPLTADPDSEDSYVLVTKQEALEELVFIIATSIQACPEAENFQPPELQQAILTACQVAQSPGNISVISIPGAQESKNSEGVEMVPVHLSSRVLDLYHLPALRKSLDRPSPGVRILVCPPVLWKGGRMTQGVYTPNAAATLIEMAHVYVEVAHTSNGGVSENSHL